LPLLDFQAALSLLSAISSNAESRRQKDLDISKGFNWPFELHDALNLPYQKAESN
jgi:hypothetical protein